MNEENAIALLKKAYSCFLSGDIDGYRQRMEQAKAAIDAQPARGAAYGELLLVSAPFRFTDLDKLLPLYEEAAHYIEGQSRVLPRGTEFFWDYYNPLTICNPTPGHMEKNTDKLGKAVKLFYRLTGGGMGTDVCYQAQLAYFRGEADRARKLAREAFETAVLYGQELTALCAAETLARIAMHSPDGSLWQFAYGHICRTASEGVSRACREYAQVYLAEMNLALGLLQTVPDWIKNGDFGAVSAPWGHRIVGDKLCHGVLPDALIAQMEYFSYSGSPIAALNAADMAQKVYGINYIIVNAHLDFFRAGCYLQLNDLENTKAALARAVNAIAPDGLWLIAAVFAPAFGELLYEAAQPYGNGAQRICEIGAGFWNKLAHIRGKMADSTPKCLTKRQEEVLSLLSSGKSNTWIARQLSISEATLKTHIRHIYEELNVSNRDELLEAMRNYHAIEFAFWASN